jgi:hypothetical protein
LPMLGLDTTRLPSLGVMPPGAGDWRDCTQRFGRLGCQATSRGYKPWENPPTSPQRRPQGQHAFSPRSNTSVCSCSGFATPASSHLEPLCFQSPGCSSVNRGHCCSALLQQCKQIWFSQNIVAKNLNWGNFGITLLQHDIE